MYFDENMLIHQYNTKQKDHFHTYVVNTGSGKESITFNGSNLWNKLLTDAKNQVMLLFQIYT